MRFITTCVPRLSVRLSSAPQYGLIARQYLVSKSAYSQNLIPYLSGLLGIYCVYLQRVLQGNSCSSIVNEKSGLYASWLFDWNLSIMSPKVGNPSTGRNTPTYVFPSDIVMCIRSRFPDPNAGKHDNQYCTTKTENVYNVTWGDLLVVKWPAPPKTCTKCGVKTAKKPY